MAHLSGRDAADYAAQHLHEVVVNGETWEVLYCCPDTGRYWKKTYPDAEYHGGGAPELEQVSLEVAREDFGVD